MPTFNYKKNRKRNRVYKVPLKGDLGGKLATLFIVLILLLSSCADSDTFINHKMTAEKIGDCNQTKAPIKMISNINGERYEFMDCVEDGFDGKNYVIERHGDSLLLKFPSTGKKMALYKFILDIDAKPAYHHITLGDQTLEIVPAERF